MGIEQPSASEVHERCLTPFVRDELVWRRVRAIPSGRVTTYGDLLPGRPRQAGAALRHCPNDVPWHRVVRADGALTQGQRQRALLEAEDVPFRGARVDMREAWVPPVG